MLGSGEAEGRGAGLAEWRRNGAGAQILADLGLTSLRVLLIGYGAMIALFARPDTFYWALLVAPLSLVGLAFSPRAIATLVRRARGVAQPQP